MQPAILILEIPSRPEFLRLVRLAAADASVRAGLQFEDVDDVRIGVEELCYALIGEVGVPGTLRLELRVAPSVLEADGRLDAFEASSIAPYPNEFGRSILRAVVDEYELAPPTFRLVKRSTRSRPADRS